MEHQKVKRAEIQEKIYQAKTVEEIRAIAVEQGESLTLEEAAKILREVEAEHATAAQEPQRSEDLTDEELAKVSGGALLESTSAYHWTALAARDGINVVIWYGSVNKRCTHWTCIYDRNKTVRIENMEMGEKMAMCTQCGEPASCGKCAHRRGRSCARDYCICPAIRAETGL